MGYFSNGSEGDMYQAEYCARCVHSSKGCPVWLVHQLFNYDQFSNKELKSTLDLLIPRKGIQNEQCRMFVEVAK